MKRLTVALTDHNYDYVKSSAKGVYGIGEVINGLIERERDYSPIEKRLTALVDRLVATIQKEQM